MSARRPPLGLSRRPLIHIPPRSRIYAFGSPSQTRKPLVQFGKNGWTVKDGEYWAVIAGADSIFKTLLGHTRIAPPPIDRDYWLEHGHLYPFVTLKKPDIDPYSRIANVSFQQRSSSAGFFDYTAHFGASWEKEDRRTLRDSLELSDAHDTILFSHLVRELNLESLLDIPFRALSNGQTRRARIARAILRKPDILLLEEPFAGLDAQSRAALFHTLQRLRTLSHTRVILGLQQGDPVPPHITHILEVKDGEAYPDESKRNFEPSYWDGTALEKKIEKVEVQVDPKAEEPPVKKKAKSNQKQIRKNLGKVVVELKNARVEYGKRRVLSLPSWQIRICERWHLRGSNGSGKSTLLSLITGAHPQSYTQHHLRLPTIRTMPAVPILAPRDEIATIHLARMVGVYSPELADAFISSEKRAGAEGRGMSVWEVVSTGFDGSFVPRRPKPAPTPPPSADIVPPAPRKMGLGGLGTYIGAEAANPGGVDYVPISSEELNMPCVVGITGVGKKQMGLKKGAQPEEPSYDANGEPVPHLSKVKTRHRVKQRAGLESWRIRRMWEVISFLGPDSWTIPIPPPPYIDPKRRPHARKPKPIYPSLPANPPPHWREYAATPFHSLSLAEQHLVLLMRALVGRPPVVLLDEPFVCLDAKQKEAVKRYLRGEVEAVYVNKKRKVRRAVDEMQACVLVSHGQDFPWVMGKDLGVRTLDLDTGEVE